MRKKTVWVLLMVLAFSLQLSARVPEVMKSWMKPVTGNQPIEYVDEDGYLHKQVAQPGGLVIDTVAYLGAIVGAANNYTTAGDYVATYFRPAAEGFITDVFIPFATPGDLEFHIMRDTMLVNLSGSTRAFGNFNHCVVDSINGFLGSMVWSITDDWKTVHGGTAVLYGDTLTPINYSHLNINNDVTLSRGNVPVAEYYRVWVGFKKLTVSATNEIWGSSYLEGYGVNAYSGHSLFTYQQNWSNPIDGPYQISWGNGQYAGDILMKVVFEYPNGTPPQVLSMTRPNNTYNVKGEKEITAKINDTDGSVMVANLKFGVGASPLTYQSVAMTYDQATDTWSGPISGNFAAGDSVYYYVEATDNDTKTRDNSRNKQYFLIKAPTNANADILVILESDDEEAIYESVLGKLGKNFETWSVTANNGLDESIIGHIQWKTIIWNAHGTSKMFYPQYSKTVLSNYDPLWKQIFTFLDGGGSLFFSDYDYFYATAVTGVDTTMDLGGVQCNVTIANLKPTDAGYNYFGVRKLWSDPFSYDTDYHPKGELDFAGIATDPITNDWAATNLSAVDLTEHWGDFIEVIPASRKILTGKAWGYDQGSRTSNGTWATVFIPWNFSILADTTGGANTSPDAEKFMKNVLDYLAAKTTSIDEDPFYTNPLRTELFANYPNPFNPTTELCFSLANAGNVQLEIFDIVGQKVKTLVNEYKSVGTCKLSWNGLDDSGNKVSSGVYFYRLKTGDYSKTQKMMFLK